jgi:hypothetical protein
MMMPPYYHPTYHSNEHSIEDPSSSKEDDYEYQRQEITAMHGTAETKTTFKGCKWNWIFFPITILLLVAALIHPVGIKESGSD